LGGYSPPEAVLIRRSRKLIVQLLSLAFLFAQLGMAVHASTHLKAEPHGGPPQLCGHCLSFAPLQNMVGGGAAIVLPLSVVHDHVADGDVISFVPARAFTAFRSRAPPRCS
jgi:hypothetical protein